MTSLTELLAILDPAKRQAPRVLGMYSLLWLPLAANAASAKQTMTTLGDSDFVALRMRFYATDTNAPPVELPTPQATLSITVGSTVLAPDGTQLHVGGFATSAAYREGLEFPYPLYIPKSTTVTAYLSNLTATAMNARLVLEGIRLLTA